jgi:hypothetical protein
VGDYGGRKWEKGLCRVSVNTDFLSKLKKLTRNFPPVIVSSPILVFIMIKYLCTINNMGPIEKFLTENFNRVITEDKNGIKCLFKHKDNLIEDGVVFFEFAKKGWTKKPISSKRQFVIVDADMRDVLQFLNQYYNLNEEDYHQVRSSIINMSIESVEKFYGD